MKDFLSKLIAQDIHVKLVGGELSVKFPKNGENKIVLEEIRARKQSIIEYLSKIQENGFTIIPTLPVADSYPISDAQRRLWVLSQFDGSIAYNLPNSILLSQDIDIESFKRAIESTIDRHEILRTVFRADETGEIRQWILTRKDLGFKIDYKDFRKAENQQELVKSYIKEDSYKPFDLEKGPLIRAGLLQVEDHVYVFYNNMHHIISDGWSVEVLSKDVFSYYEAYKDNKEPELIPLRIQYKDYSAWQLAQLEEESYKFHKAYWLDTLSGELPLLDLPATKQRPVIKTHNGHGVSTYISSETTIKLRKYSEQNGGSLFMGLLAAWNILLYHYTSQKDIIIGTPIAGREHADLEDQIGFYVNTLVLRNVVNPEESFNAFFGTLKDNTLKSYSHQMYPFDRLVEEINIQRDTSRSAVFDIMIDIQNNGEKTQEAEIKQEDHNCIKDHGYGASKFDLNISFKELGDYLSLYVMYNPDVYELNTVESLINHYKQLLNALLESPEEKISQIDYLSEKEKQELLFRFNDTDLDYARDKTIIDLFEEQVSRTPNNIALVFGEQELTYQELNERSNQLAAYLQKKYKIKPDDLVSIKLERSEWMLISIVGILKSGGAYVPIDPEDPQERMEHILNDSQCKIVIDEKELERFKEEVNEYGKKNLKSINKSSDLAYVIYTSGSTGIPKGVMVEHKGVCNLINGQTKTFNITDAEKILQFSNYFFDASVEQIFLALFNGASLFLIPKDLLLDTRALETFIEEQGITHLHATPGFLETINPANCKTLNRVIAGGDVCKKELQKSWAGVADFYNEYGPTETTVTVTEYYCSRDGIERSDILPIGKPLPNMSVYILTETLLLSPKGVIGEICISGDGLARGYLNQEELTKEKFIANPFKVGERLYKTGDLGRWLADGNIEFYGRKDDQVKIRGYRIELGEIEYALLKNEQIDAAVVLAKETGKKEKELVAYLTSKTEQTTSELRSYLKEFLPEYMLPAYFVQLEALPLTVNGKIDKKSLPAPQGLGLASGIEYVAPENETEEKLVGIWQEILRKEKEDIGIDEGFFAAGGNSIKLIALRSKIEREFNTNCQIASLFKYTTVRQQANMLLNETIGENEADEETSNLYAALDEENNVKGSNDIAVIGMSIKTPGAKNIHEFWENLRNGKESITHFSREEMLSFGVSEKDLDNKNYVRANAYLEEKECFDSGFFGYLPDEAKLMDPQTRVFHEVVWSALEDSGYDPLSYKGLIGLYAGTGGNSEWEAYGRIVNDAIDRFTASQLIDKDFSNTFIAHKLNLKGPVYSIHTACSTSLVAIHQAVRSILAGETNIAIAGGTFISSKRRETGYMYQEDMVLSKDGHNRAFDSDSSGTMGGEGSGAVVLKKLSEAIKDGDQIYAVIKGSAINNDGNRKVGYTAPSVDGQSAVIRRAQHIAKVKPEAISYIEAHGTATKLGDPIEVLALTRAFGKQRTNQYCALGSVKTNVGHLDAAAGVAGFIKTALCLKHKELVPSLHFESPNPEINFQESPFYVNTELKEWPKGNVPRLAGVSSFGIGGTNAHVILEEAPTVFSQEKESSLEIITLSAKTNEALERHKENLKSFLEQHKDVSISDLAWTLQNRHSFLYRSSFIAQTTDQVISSLEKTGDVKFKNKKVNDRNKKIAFLFPGGGSQYQNMGRGLYEMKGSTFRKTMDHCFEISEKLSDIDFKSILYSDEPDNNKEIYETINALPILLMFEYSLAMQMQDYGIEPDIMIGHSMGEYVAACFAGTLTLEGALIMSIKRGELIQEVSKGAMMAVEISADEIGEYLSDRVDLAAVNTPTSCVVSGHSESINELSKKFEEKNISAKILYITHASHSMMMEPMLDKFTEVIEHVEITSPKIPYISNLTGLKITSKELNDRKYWSTHLRSTVNFSSGIGEILSHDNVLLIEVGPGNVLSNFARQHFKKNTSAEVHQLIRHPKIEEDDTVFLLNKIADLWKSGLKIDWQNLNKEYVKRKISIPTYSFERLKYPMGGDVINLISEYVVQLNEEKRLDESEWYYEPSWKKSKLPQQPAAGQKDGWYLVFSDEGGIAQNLIGLPEMNPDKTIIAKCGSEYKKISEYEFELNPYDYEGYSKLFNELSLSTIHPANIVHLLSLEQNLQSQDDDERNKALGYYSLLHIAKELNKIDNQQPINLSVITNKLERIFGNEIIHPSKSLMQGLLIVISQENPWIQSRLIDMSQESDEYCSAILLSAEIKSMVREKFIAYRNNIRWVKEFNSLVMPSIHENESKIKNGGTYLITGGLGGLAFTYSKYLLEKYNVNLILVGRSEISVSEDDDIALTGHSPGNKDLERKSRFHLLQKMGNVSYNSANISDLASMKKVVENAEQKFGEINGVIHTAAVLEGPSFSAINFLSVAECEKQFDPKINGIGVIEEIFRDRELDFCLLTSSLASIIGGKEFGAYAPVSAYLDNFSNGGKIKNSVSVNFGSLISNEELNSELNVNEQEALNPREIVKVLEMVLLANGDTQILVSPIKLDNRIKKWVYPKPEKKVPVIENQIVLVNVERSNLSVEYAPPKSKTEIEICNVFAEFFGINEIGIDDNFFELGGDSLKAMTLIYRIHKKFSVKLRIKDIFEQGNIRNLSKKIDLLTNINQMKQERPKMNFENKIEI